MRDAFLVLLLLGGAALLVVAMTRVTARRRATDAAFVAERPLPTDLRVAMMSQKTGGPTTAAQPAAASPPAEPGATAAPPAPAAAPPVQHLVPLVDALSGMQLPCDLVFLGTVEAEPGVREVLAFSSATTGAEAVSAAMATELQRLGYALYAGGEQVTLATRDELALRMEVHPHPASVMRKKKPAFPTAAAGAVVVEITRS